MEFYTSRSPAKCAALLSASMDDEGTFKSGFYGSLDLHHAGDDRRPFAGRATDEGVRLRVRVSHALTSKVIFLARFRAQGAGTLISGSFGPRWWDWILIAWFFGCLVYIAFTEPYGVWGCLLFIFFWMGLLSINRPQVLREERAIKNFLIETLETREVGEANG